MAAMKVCPKLFGKSIMLARNVGSVFVMNRLQHKQISCLVDTAYCFSPHVNIQKAGYMLWIPSDLSRTALCPGGLEKDPISAFRSYRRGCIQQKSQEEGKNDRIANSCANMGSLLVMHKHETNKLLAVADEKQDYSKADNKVEISNPPQTAMEAYQRSCLLKDGLGCNLLSQMYMAGFENQCKRDFRLAAHYADKACELGDASACHNLAVMYERGDGVPVDKKKAAEKKAKKEEILKGSVSLQFGAQ